MPELDDQASLNASTSLSALLSQELTDTSTIRAYSKLEALILPYITLELTPLSVGSQLTVTPSILSRVTPGLIYVSNKVGDSDAPGNIVKLRRSVAEALFRLGSPVVIKHMFGPDDVERGVAIEASTLSKTYSQTRINDMTHGIGYVSIETWDKEWMDEHGNIVISDTPPGPGWTQAPKYRGYGPGHLTWIVEPDAAVDIYKPSNIGALTRTQTATAQMGWVPEVWDNDLIVNVVLDDAHNVIDTKERYEAKMTTPVTMRGRENRGKRERGVVGAGGNRYIINQQFEMTKIPLASQAMRVPVDR